MAIRGKSINLFLMDGTSSGRIKCTLANWTGLAYKIPRTELDKCKERNDLKQSGVYFLFGESEDTDESVVYIGQAGVRKNGEGVLCRLFEHKQNSNKDYWTEAIVFTTSNNTFGPTEISYLENRFCKLATEANRYILKNSNEPNIGNITEEKESELEEFVDYAKIIMGTLGHNLFVPLIEKPKIDKGTIETEEEDLILYFERKSGKSGDLIKASGKQTSEGFVVLKGSRIEIMDSKSIPPRVKEMRKKANIGSDKILLKDTLLTSPSAAAAFVIGGFVNGLTEWKTKDSISLKEIENQQGNSF